MDQNNSMNEPGSSTENDIAIVGMACRFPGADTPDQFWTNLRDGHESLTALSDEELQKAGVSKAQLSNPNYVKGGMFLDGFDAFDAEFFGFSPLDAKILDPQHRHFLECSWEAFEDAGYIPEQIDGAVGVFAGSGYNAYLSQNLLSGEDLLNDVGFFLLRHTGNDKDFLATRVSYLLNLKGPSINVQTACSTSLVAVHMASQSLLNAECDMALAGGVTIEMPHKQGYLFKESEILSPDGHCRPFDADSKGTVFGSGVGCVLLKRYDDAIADNDHIHAVVKGSAINNDGSDKVSYLAPSVDGQIAAIQEALDVAEVDANSVSYVECHGTGTQLGDPIEIAALAQAFDNDDASHRCGIGSVKSNIGHTDTAAGVASLIKVVQSLKHKQLAPTLHYQHANPAIDFENSPFYVNAELQKWQSDAPLRAGVSSLGVGGTNAHVVLEEVTRKHPVAADDSQEELILLSAKNELSLQKYHDALADHLDHNNHLGLTDVSYTLATGRQAFRFRSFAVADSIENLSETLDSGSNSGSAIEAPREVPQTVYMFAGGGSQHANMGRELYNSEPVYRQSIDECLSLIDEYIDFDLRSIMFPEAEQSSDELASPGKGLPALFITQYAQAKLWQSWGVPLDAMIGHSMGENTAACLAGVFSLKDALGLVSLRGKLFDSVERGGMISVSISADDLKELTTPLELDIAASNAPELSVASGSREKLEQLQTILASRDVDFQRVHIDVAAHSRMLENILDPFRTYLQSISLNTPQKRFISNLHGGWITDEQATSPDYWVDHLRNTVAFDAGIQTLLADADYNFLEVGPGRTLASLTRLQKDSKGCCIESSLPHIDDTISDRRAMLDAVGKLWQHGAAINLKDLFNKGRKVSLPTYQFAKTRHWVEAESKPQSENKRAETAAEFFYQPAWQREASIKVDADAIKDRTILLFCGMSELDQSLLNHLKATCCKLVVATADNGFTQTGDGLYSVNPQEEASLIALFNALSDNEELPDTILHTLALECDGISDVAATHKDIQVSFDSLFLLSRAAINADLSHDFDLVVLTQGAQQVAGEPIRNPIQSLVAGPCRVIPRECPNISCQWIDLPDQVHTDNTIHVLISALSDANTSATLALRGNAFYAPVFQKTQTQDAVTQGELTENGTYLITGGTGGLGLIAAETLSAAGRCNIVLSSRSSLPPKSQWQQLIEDNDHQAGVLRRLKTIEASGSTISHFSANTGDLQAVMELRTAITDQFGPLNGIVHTAGIVDDNPIAIKTLEECQSVLQPKVTGTLILDHVFDFASLDFTVLYSSISSFTGLPGQIDYAAANAFLDSYSNYASAKGTGTITSINWPAWKEDGMAARMVSPNRSASGTATSHPLLDACTVSTDGKSQYSSSLSVENTWMLDEHRLANGTALIPGSGFIELSRAAFAETTGHRPARIRNATFLSPFAVADEQTRELTVSLEKREDNCFDFSINSEDNGSTVVHATGSIESIDLPFNTTDGNTTDNNTDVSELINRCGTATQSFEDSDHHPNLRFGPRWASLQKVHIGQQEAAIELNLDQARRSELDDFALHPALLDMATGGAQVIIPGYQPESEFYVPVEYGTLNFYGEFPAESISHVTLQHHDAEIGTAVFDIAVYDHSGRQILSVDSFTMQRIPPDSIKVDLADNTDNGNPLLNKTMEMGILSEEGVEILEAIFNGATLPQRIVSTYEPVHVIEQLIKSQQDFTPGKRREQVTVAHDPDQDTDLPRIESTLADNDAIEFVAVRSHLNEDGSRRLVAHYKPDDWEGITVSELRKYARDVLQRHEVPQHFVELDDIPVLETGEIDRKSLHDPYAPVDRHVAPRNPIEQQLADIWAEVLGADKVSVTDNFFDIGGHSLLSIRVIVRAQKVFSAQLDQAQMVLLTLEQLANEIQRQLPDYADTTDVIPPPNPDTQIGATSQPV